MKLTKPTINPYLFDEHFNAFRKFVETRSGMSFRSFAGNSYTNDQEGYKETKVRYEARRALNVQDWRDSDCGTGKVAKAAIGAIEIKDNNLVTWPAKYGASSRPHQALYVLQEGSEDLVALENCLLSLFRGDEDEQNFHRLQKIFGSKYPLLGYFYFLKDSSTYLPIAPESFDRAFKVLGADFQTNRNASWENYITYLDLISQIRSQLAEKLPAEVSLLNAHSFTWILVRQMEEENTRPNVSWYFSLPETERETYVKARIGQGRFRESLLSYWGGCAVTGCVEPQLLCASHIKPWAESDNQERLDLYNGLLLSAHLDACFDRGYITFDDEGKIHIGARLTPADAQALGINSNMRLRTMLPQHRK